MPLPGVLSGRRFVALAIVAVAVGIVATQSERFSGQTTGVNTQEPICDPRFCGNGEDDPGEQCDDGNTVAGDKCDPLCRIECITDRDCPSGVCAGGICDDLCGNGVVDDVTCTATNVCSQKEECDEGSLNGQDGRCTRRCTFCGNGKIDVVNGVAEQCDLGDRNGEEGASCTNRCVSANGGTCGNERQDEGEDCDTGANNRSTAPENLKDWYCKTPSCTRTACFDGADNDSDQLPDALDAGCWKYDIPAARNGNLLGSLIAQGTTLGELTPEEYLAGKDDEACPAGTVDRGAFCMLTCQQGETCPNGEECPVDGVCPEVCGNGMIDAALGEQCDDGNLVNDDGCSNLCRSTCTGNACPRCGDGVKQEALGEQCDDGTAVTGDACSNNCRMFCDSDDDCPGTCDETTNQCVPAACGDGKTNQTWERCDDGNVDNQDRCNNQCQPTCSRNADCETGRCDQERLVCVPLCGNARVDAGEQCDDGNAVNNDTCANTCVRRCSDDTTCDCDEGSGTCRAETTAPRCGDGVVNGTGEQCDDGNADDGDSCTTACRVRCGQNLECPSGLLCVGEQCVGCSSSLQCDGGFCVDGRCRSALPLCGNGVIEAGESCDDGNASDADGCSSNCLFPIGHACGSAAQCQTHLCSGGACAPCADAGQCAAGLRCAAGNCLYGPLLCGDGAVQAGEACDDANLNDNDQCTSACLKPIGGSCGHATDCASTICSGGACAPCRSDAECAAGQRCAIGRCMTDAQMALVPNVCGNGAVDAGEQCDDGNNAYGDGCTPACAAGDARREDVAANVSVQLPFVAEEPSFHAGAENLSDTGPATVAIMAAGAAAGTAWVRRRFARKPE